MSVFNFLPIVDNGCCCLKLKLASILIAVYGIVSLGWSTYYMKTHTICAPDSSLAPVMKYAKIILITGDVNVVIGAVIFLIGILIRRRITGELFLLTIAVLIFAYLFYSIAGLVVSSTDDKCQDFGFPISVFIRIFLWTYFMIIIRSFKEQME